MSSQFRYHISLCLRPSSITGPLLWRFIVKSRENSQDFHDGEMTIIWYKSFKTLETRNS